MTQYILRTSLEEADAIVKGEKSFVFRSEKHKYGYGDKITFQTYKAGRPTPHPIDRMKFCITHVETEAPIEKGWKVIGFKRIKEGA